MPAPASETWSEDVQDYRDTYHRDCDETEYAVRPLTLKTHDHLDDDEREPCRTDDSCRRHESERREGPLGWECVEDVRDQSGQD